MPNDTPGMVVFNNGSNDPERWIGNARLDNGQQAPDWDTTHSLIRQLEVVQAQLTQLIDNQADLQQRTNNVEEALERVYEWLIELRNNQRNAKPEKPVIHEGDLAENEFVLAREYVLMEGEAPRIIRESGIDPRSISRFVRPYAEANGGMQETPRQSTYTVGVFRKFAYYLSKANRVLSAESFKVFCEALDELQPRLDMPWYRLVQAAVPVDEGDAAKA